MSRRSLGKNGAAGNETGTRRVANDTLVDLYNCVQKWNLSFTQSSTMVTSVYEVDRSQMTDADSQQRVESIMAQVVLMRAAVRKMDELCSKLTNLSLLETEYRLNTWSLTDLATACKKLCAVYRKDTEGKTHYCRVFSAVLLAKRHDMMRQQLLWMNLLWTHSAPGPEEQLLLKSALLEAGLISL